MSVKSLFVLLTNVVVVKFSVRLVLNWADMISNVNVIGAKKKVVSPEMLLWSHSGDAMSGKTTLLYTSIF
jgi:hypothetical protein